MLPLSVDALTQRSDTVVRGKVKATESRFTPDGKRVYTVVTLEVSEAWKGNPGSTLEIQVPGGSLDGIDQKVMGAPSFEVGEDAVVFLRRLGTSRKVSSIVGMAQGKLSVQVDSAGNELAVQQLSGLELVEPGTLKPVESPLREPVPVGKLQAKVRAVRP
ncbi:hypothetical protein AKJ08_1507 [Vulgatibacter incomptus]|uniref:Uncharacterized protein n=2 Tax=Vulgatibacter incomptus TaxID=1391653 RepID=A0A0K1PC72_9BACT|nr:hypothetical protein AKJ08_1507 [Vulgatibacter incomptus]